MRDIAWAVLLAVVLGLTGCGKEPKTVSYYKTHDQERKDRVTWCNEHGYIGNLGFTGQSSDTADGRDCNTAVQATVELLQPIQSKIQSIDHQLAAMDLQSMKGLNNVFASKPSQKTEEQTRADAQVQAKRAALQKEMADLVAQRKALE